MYYCFTRGSHTKTILETVGFIYAGCRRKTAQLTSLLIDRILAQMEATLIYAKIRIKWYTKEINELLFSQPYIKPKLIGDFLDISSRTTLTKYFAELVKEKILTPIRDGKELF